MDASGTPAPPPHQPPPPPPPTATSQEPSGPATGWRVIASLWFVLTLAIAGIGIAVMVDLGSSPICADVGRIPLGPVEDCYEISSAEKTVGLVLGWSGSLLVLLSGGLSVLFAITGRKGALAAALGVAGFVLCAVTLVVA